METSDAEAISIAELFSALGDQKELCLTKFQDIYWGKRILNVAVQEETWEKLDAAFHHGEISEILKDCRKEDTNALFSPEEMSDMASDLENQQVTLILPFCYCPGAIQLRSSFIQEMGNFGSDIEVGVYFSQVGGAPAPWHFDNNHNITIQLRGQKDWHCIPGNPNTFKNRAMSDVPKNYIEQKQEIPSTHCVKREIYHLDPGSVIYLPPGYWHSVVPIEGDSISIDIRIGNILYSKWICEAIFTNLLETFGAHPIASLGPHDRQMEPNGLSKPILDQIEYLTQNLSSTIKSCRIPRPLLPEEAYSNGIHSGASLEFLVVNMGEVLQWPEEPSVLYVNRLVSLSLKHHASNIIILQMLSVSSLTNSEYFRFNLYCPASVHAPLQALISHGKISFDSTHSESPTTYANLFQILYYSNVVHNEPNIFQQKKRKLQQ